MQTSVKIMDIDVDMISNDVFIQKINEYLTSDRLDMILFASTELLNRAVEDEQYHELIDRADMFLPGEEALLITHHVDILEAGGMVVNCKSFGIVLENLRKEERSLYIVGKTEEEVETLIAYCKRMQPELRVVGHYAYDRGLEEASVINEINSHTPDMLLLDLDIGMQETWLMEHAPMMNAKLCIAIGGVAHLILADQKEVPRWVKVLHLEKLYQKIVQEQRIRKDFQAKHFRKKVVSYYNKIEENTETSETIEEVEVEAVEEKKKDSDS